MKPVPLTQQLVDSIREDILSGHYEPHSNLRQDALAEKYGVSRIPVREALLQLEGEGLVSIQPRRGAIVTPLSLLEVDDVFALRLLLEIRLYHASAPKLDAAAIETASEVNQRYRDAIANQQHAVLGAINAELHMALYREAPLPTTRQIVAALLQTSQRYTRIQLRTGAATIPRRTRPTATTDARRQLPRRRSAFGRTHPPRLAQPARDDYRAELFTYRVATNLYVYRANLFGVFA